MNQKTPLLLAIAIMASLSGCACRERVDPGNVGILLDYSKVGSDGKPNADVIPTGSYAWVDWVYGRLIEYPIAEQTLIMVKNPNEGQRDDDAVTCRALGGAQMQVEVAATWQIDLSKPEYAVDLYLRRPGAPLVGDINKSVEGSVVRQAVRNAIGLVCGQMAPLDMMASQKAKLQEDAEKLAQSELVDYRITVKDFFVRDVIPPDDLVRVIAITTEAQQRSQAAQFDVQTAQAQATANAVRREGLTVAEKQRQDIIDKWDGHIPPSYGNAQPVIALDAVPAQATPRPVATVTPATK
jgi:regulator of protease activity HflC (stomatin/prohibitin superfamily)